MIFFSSDYHLNHINICRGVSSWNDDNMTRDFDTINQMNKAIIDNTNSVVGQNDTLYILGDFAFCGVDTYLMRDSINCSNIHYICGNHSNKHGQEYDPVMKNGKRVSSLFGSYGFYKEIFPCKTPIILFHFPISSWNHMSKGSIHLFGHCHSKREDRFFNGGKSMDVGLDGNNLMPYHIDEIFDLMKDRPVKKEGHHV